MLRAAVLDEHPVVLQALIEADIEAVPGRNGDPLATTVTTTRWDLPLQR